MRPSSSARALSRSARCVSSSSTCATASSYSCLASGLTGPSCSRRRSEALDALSERLALLVGQRLGGGLGLEAEAAGDAGQVALGVGRGVAHLLCGDLGAGHRLAGALQPPLELRLLVGAGLERGGGLLTGGGAGLELPVERLASGRDSVARCLQRGGGALGVGRQGEVALGAGAKRGERAGALLALALDALGEPLLGAQVSEQLRPPHGLGTVLRRLAAARHQPLGAAQRVRGVGGGTEGGAEGRLGVLACGVRVGDGGGVALYRRTRLRLVANGLL